MELEALRYPVGRYRAENTVTPEIFGEWIEILDAFPAKLRTLVGSLTEGELESRYREGGWTVRQVVHHVVDSHLNSYVRFKWTLTEDKPKIKTYDQALWAEQVDAKTAPVGMSLDFLAGLHARWVYLLRRLTPEQWHRTFYHPEYNKEFDLLWLLGLYAWHCRHHYAHIELALNAPA